MNITPNNNSVKNNSLLDLQDTPIKKVETSEQKHARVKIALEKNENAVKTNAEGINTKKGLLFQAEKDLTLVNNQIFSTETSLRPALKLHLTQTLEMSAGSDLNSMVENLLSMEEKDDSQFNFEISKEEEKLEGETTITLDDSSSNETIDVKIELAKLINLRTEKSSLEKSIKTLKTAIFKQNEQKKLLTRNLTTVSTEEKKLDKFIINCRSASAALKTLKVDYEKGWYITKLFTAALLNLPEEVQDFLSKENDINPNAMTEETITALKNLSGFYAKLTSLVKMLSVSALAPSLVLFILAISGQPEAHQSAITALFWAVLPILIWLTCGDSDKNRFDAVFKAMEEGKKNN